ncbi:ER degradation-enhancing alpha-mannosidase-like protein 2 isoform X1 [Ostrinia furnacalis]|uniref:ER degradation-enhancing alpha-mannosidase-like protein 2 isoform X1 n=1 Tax=Ostrinia furnacalis TaxID=93504 RepID=UPI0010389539|nr:ER degradation-enhancing alpha-mannosidase-like protein 2 isoform X1 [Ostrinia furnacalis]
MILKASICLFLLFFCNKCSSLREYSKEDILRLREEVREMFQHAYDSYLRYAYPYDELRPLSCDGVDTWGSYSLTLIDALDTLAIMGNYTEFNRVVDILLQKKNFDSDINVSVFETNIRITGGLLSAHLLSYKTGAKLEPGWPCNGPLLRLAEDVAQRLIAAFDTTTGMPYGTINLRSGVPPGETSVTCTAGVGTFIIEFGTLSRLTGDPLYEEVALNALKALYHHRSPIGLVGNHIDVMTGRWTAQDAGIGGGVDSYYEYLVKGAILLEKPELMSMFLEARQSIDRYLRKDDWFVWATMLRGHVTLPVFQSLESYYPGLLSLIGESDTAMRIIHNYHSVWKQYGFTPEVYNLGTGEASTARESYPLRPELIESIMYLYRDTRDPILLQMGEDILRSIQHSAKTNCGYATIKDVRDHRKEDRMESFFLAETTKYLYLLFDPDNFIHNPGVHGTVINTPNGECVVDVGGYIFNTEAHPIDPTMLYCCHEAKQGINISEVHRVYQLLEEEDNIKFMTLIEASENKKNNNKTENVKNTQVVVEETSNVTTEGVLVENKIDQNQVLIKTETRTGYVNIDGTERENIINESSLTEIVKEKLSKYYNGSLLLAEADDSETVTDENSTDTDKPVDKDVEVDDIIVASQDPDTLQPPSSSRAKEAYKLLPKAIQEFLNNDWKTRPKCEPQRILERIRRENKYPEHMDVDAYELLLTPAPSFLQRISLAGEFLSKKQMQT